MGILHIKPNTPGQRFTRRDDFSDITQERPYKPLTYSRKKTGGRNARGRVTARWIGGGHKQRVRLLDFKRKRYGVPAEVLTIEYDPIRSARVSLVQYETGEKSYVLAPKGLQVGQKIMSGPDVDLRVGNALPLERIPSGTQIHNIELIPGQGGKIVRSAGSSATVMSKETQFAHVKLPSGEVRMISLKCFATIGQCSNPEHENVQLGKAGRSRWIGRRPRVRGVAMNPVDHPMGGGEGKTSGGRHPCSPSGQIAKGLKTRRRSKPSDKFIVNRRRKRNG